MRASAGNFLQQKQLRAAVLSGPWGVGKTYFAPPADFAIDFLLSEALRGR